jgi:hypothetical protein
MRNKTGSCIIGLDGFLNPSQKFLGITAELSDYALLISLVLE